MKISRSFTIASLAELCDRFSFYGLQSLVIIFLLHAFHFSMTHAYSVYGVFSSLSFALCILGGLVSDKLLGEFQTIFYGLFFMLLGNLCFFLFHNINVTFLGIAFIVFGTGFVKPASSCLVGHSYDNNESLKHKAFVYYYTLASIGGVAGPLIYGVGVIYNYYVLGFIVSSIVLIVSMIATLLLCKSAAYQVPTKIKQVQFIICFLLALLVVYSFFIGLLQLKWFLPPLAVVCIYLSVRMLKKEQRFDKQHIAALLIAIITSIIFLVVLLQIFSSITVFIDRFIDTSIVGFRIPVTWFTSSESLFVIIISPFVASLWSGFSKTRKSVSEFTKIGVGLFFIAVAFLLLVFAGVLESFNHILTLVFIFSAFLFFAIGELAVIPTSINLISSHTPQKFNGMMMGVYYFSLASSGYLAGLFAKYSMKNGHQTLHHVVSFFFTVSVSLCILVILLFVIIRVLKVTPISRN